MISLLSVLKEAVSYIPEITINGVPRKVHFESGGEDRLLNFMERTDGDALPLIWLIPPSPREGLYNQYIEADAVLNVCYRETDVRLLSTERDELAFKQVLRPVWENFTQALRRTNRASLVDETLEITEFANYQVGAGNPGKDIWDVLQVNATIRITEKFKC